MKYSENIVLGCIIGCLGIIFLGVMWVFILTIIFLTKEIL